MRHRPYVIEAREHATCGELWQVWDYTQRVPVHLSTHYTHKDALDFAGECRRAFYAGEDYPEGQ